MAMHIRKGDKVQVIRGDHKGAQGTVLRIDMKQGRVVIEGVNMVYRHVRPSRRNPQGGRLQKEAPIHMSNVLPVDERTGKPTRVRFETQPDGSKQRVAVRSGGVIHRLRRPKAEA
jgi:large subunit ribosomal protein L24